MKKLLIPILIFVLSFSFVYGQNKEKQDVLRLKSIFNIDKEYSDFNFSEEAYEKGDLPKFLKDRVKNNNLLSYYWSDENLGNISITTSQDGQIFNYRAYSNRENNNTENISIDRKKAKEVAEDLLKKIDPNFFNKYKFQDISIENERKNITFTYIRYINDIAFFEDKAQITYSPSENKIINFSKYDGYNYGLSLLKDEDFKIEDKISLKKAIEISKKYQPLQEAYMVNSKNVNKVYSALDFRAISAKNGQLLKKDDVNYVTTYKGADEAVDKASLTDVEEKTLDNIKNLKSKEDALKIAKEILGKDIKISQVKLTSQNDNYTYFIENYSKNEGGEVSIDAKNLNLLSFYTSSDDKSGKIENSKEVIKIAKAFTEKYYKDSEISLDKAQVNANTVFFPRYVNNRYVIGEGINIEINGKTKKVQYFMSNKSRSNFPKDKYKLSVDEAQDILYSSNYFTKKYVLDSKGIDLVYHTKTSDNPTISEDGFIISSYGEIVDFKDQISYPDLDKAKNKDIINNLKDMGIGLINKKLKDPISTRDFMNLVSFQNNPFEVDNYLLKKYDIKEEDLDKKIKEKDLIKLLISINSNEEFLKLKGIFKEDLFENQKSLKDYEIYYIYAKGYGIFNQEPSPQSPVNLEDALYMIYGFYNK